MHFYFFTITCLLRYLLCLFLVNLSLSFSSVKFISENLGKKKEKILVTKRFSAYLNYFKLMKKKKREKRIFHLKRDFLEINCFVKLSLLKNFVTYTGCVYYWENVKVNFPSSVWLRKIQNESMSSFKKYQIRLVSNQNYFQKRTKKKIKDERKPKKTKGKMNKI